MTRSVLHSIALGSIDSQLGSLLSRTQHNARLHELEALVEEQRKELFKKVRARPCDPRPNLNARDA